MDEEQESLLLDKTRPSIISNSSTISTKKKHRLRLPIPEKYRNRKKQARKEQLTEKFWPFGKRLLTPKEQVHIVLALVGMFWCLAIMLKIRVIDFALITRWPRLAAAMATIACATSYITHPMAVYNQCQLTLFGTLRDVINELREGANQMIGENDKLIQSTDELETEVDRLKELEEGFQGSAASQGIQLNEFIELMAENKRINRELKKAIQANTLQRIMGTMMDCDINDDFRLEGTEIDRLIIGIKHVEDVEIDEEGFRELIVENGGSLDVVFDIMKSWFTVDEEEEKRQIEKEEADIKKLHDSLGALGMSSSNRSFDDEEIVSTTS